MVTDKDREVVEQVDAAIWEGDRMVDAVGWQIAMIGVFASGIAELETLLASIRKRKEEIESESEL